MRRWGSVGIAALLAVSCGSSLMPGGAGGTTPNPVGDAGQGGPGTGGTSSGGTGGAAASGGSFGDTGGSAVGGTGLGGTGGTAGADTAGSGGRGGTAGSGGTGGSAGSSGTGGVGPFCVQDCGGYSRCVGGVVTSYPLASRPCGVACPAGNMVGTCQKGCATSMYSFSGCALELCKENVPKHAGDPCETDDDCRPSKATVNGTQISNVYLACDLATGLCVTRAPTTLADWMAPCSRSVVAPLEGMPDQGSPQLYNDPGCSGGLCIAASDGTCVRQGCTKHCRTDDECPSGSQCAFYTCDAFSSVNTGYCTTAAASLNCGP